MLRLKVARQVVLSTSCVVTELTRKGFMFSVLELSVSLETSPGAEDTLAGNAVIAAVLRLEMA